MSPGGRPISIAKACRLVMRGWELHETLCGIVTMTSPRGHKYRIKQHGRRFWAIPI